jgi:hypothetical protein
MLAKKLPRHRHVDEFDRYLLVELSVGAMREIDGTHASPPQKSVKFVGSHHRRIPRIVRCGCLDLVSVLLFRFARAEQRTQLVHQGSVALAASLQDGGSLRFGYSGDLMK